MSNPGPEEMRWRCWRSPRGGNDIRTTHSTGQFPEAHAHPIVTLFDGGWTTEAALPAVMAGPSASQTL
ncbi:hypothetical protein [Streptomyces sp. enrichment culture]|uniref:hypothetical protein n=1 Tax=Streptomyces sp. enrichment culture TaxID=1795815 RepID=UPI003F5622AE